MAVSAQALLGAVLFLAVMSYLALPCMARDASQFQSVGAPNACSQHDIFKPAADLPKLLSGAVAERTFRVPFALAVLALPPALVSFARHDARSRLKRRTRPWSVRLPFSTADPPKLPAFAALRDA